jgi:FtsH-binding integral membrane protein
MLIKTFCAAVTGLEATTITIEVHTERGMQFHLSGLADTAVRESYDRIRAATTNTGLKLPTSDVTINLSPADIRKEGSGYDLPLAIGLLAAFGKIGTDRLEQMMMIGELGLVMWISAGINRLSLTSATLLFVLYSVINGVTMSFIFLAYTRTSIASVFFITAGTFAIMAFIGYTTKTDLSSMGKILFMALIGLILATIVNIFLKSPMFNYILSWIGVAIFVGLTAYDTQKIKQMLMYQEAADEQGQKIALLGALSLYLDFINLFLYLLRIFGNRE